MKSRWNPRDQLWVWKRRLCQLCMGEIPQMSFLRKSLTKTEQTCQLYVLMPEELVGSHSFPLLWIAHLYKKASYGTVREFCEFRGCLGFSDACFLTGCVRWCFFGFFYTVQLVIGKHLYLFSFAPQCHCSSAWAYTAFGSAFTLQEVCVTPGYL